MPKPKIDLALAATWQLVANFIRPGVDRLALASIANNFRMEQDFTDDKARIRSALEALRRTVINTNEGTALYDGIPAGIDAFWAAGRRQAAWMYVIVTDGEDKHSVGFKEALAIEKVAGVDLNPEARLGLHVRERFNREPSNFPVIVGVGAGHQINERGLATIASYGGFPAVAIDSFQLLEALFVDLAVQMTSQLYGGPTFRMGNQTWTEIAEVRRRIEIPIDVLILMDRSGSMKEQEAVAAPAARPGVARQSFDFRMN